VLLVSVDRVPALPELAAIVDFQGRREHHIDPTIRDQGLRHGDGGAGLSGSETVVDEQTPIGSLRREVLAHNLLMREEFAGIATLRAQVDVLVIVIHVSSPVLEKDTCDVVRERLTIR